MGLPVYRRLKRSLVDFMEGWLSAFPDNHSARSSDASIAKQKLRCFCRSKQGSQESSIWPQKQIWRDMLAILRHTAEFAFWRATLRACLCFLDEPGSRPAQEEELRASTERHQGSQGRTSMTTKSQALSEAKEA